MQSHDATEALSRTELRNKRLDDLLQSCQEQMLTQVVGPFGLTPGMFDDKDGGNVTTAHNFEKGITATEEDNQRFQEFKNTNEGGYDRKEYDKELPKIRKELFKQDGAPVSAYTGKELPKDGGMHMEHVTAAKTIESDASANLFMSKQQRVDMANQSANLKPVEGNINQSLSDTDRKDWLDSERQADKGKTNGESFGIDRELFEQTVNTSKSAIKQDLLVAQIKKQGAELAATSAKDAGKNALRQAFGVLLHELITGMISELKELFKRKNMDNLIDEITKAFQRVFARVKSKVGHALDAAKSGGIAAILSNILTFIINKVVTTSAKLVTVIREGITGFVKAVKFMLSPPENMSKMDVARETSKLIAAVLATSAGMLLEEALGSALLSIAPILAPIIEIVSPALTALLTGIGTALVIYSLDRFFDWLSSTGTELLASYENNLSAMQNNVKHMADWIQEQYQNSHNYAAISNGYVLIECQLEEAQESQKQTMLSGQSMLNDQSEFNRHLDHTIEEIALAEQDVMAMLDAYPTKDRN